MDINKWSIGVFDSGIGGLTVVKEIRNILPEEKIIYLGDTARVPYGSRSRETIIKYSRENARFLMEKGIKLLVVACNTASSLALDELKEHMPVNVIGVVEPGARKAVRVTKSGRIGVIGTEATIRSRSYERALLKIDSRLKIFPRACPLFVPLVEEGMIEHKITYSVAEHYLADLKKFKIDVLILGCTHYPVLKKVIQKTVGENVTLVDSAEEVARVVEYTLNVNGIGIKGDTQKSGNTISNRRKMMKNKTGKVDFYVTDAPDKFTKLAKIFLYEQLTSVKRAELF
jgi:glutamate racemase